LFLLCTCFVPVSPVWTRPHILTNIQCGF
jgi:hypothetical protein